jgi:hypothetical protein
VREVPLLASRSPTLQVVSAIVLPIVFGLICGIALGINAALYGVLTVAAILGGIGAGYEHYDAAEGAARGVAGGLLFGTFILFGHAVAGTHAKAALPNPHVVLVLLTVLGGVGFGALGGTLRRRHTRRVEGAAAPVEGAGTPIDPVI